mgnify:CR=1 FL=1
MLEKLKSRKFWVAIGGSILPLIGNALTGAAAWEESITLSIGVVISYLLAQGAVDTAAELRK